MAKRKIKKVKSRKPARRLNRPKRARRHNPPAARRKSKIPREAKPVIEINHQWCKGCYICIESCPQGVFGKSDKLNDRGFYPVTAAKAGSCTKCLECEILCPDLAITVQ
ncbi:MAG: 4Fe-4S dicluster domain-containing protein [Candidatus Omnitrophota bacterium]